MNRWHGKIEPGFWNCCQAKPVKVVAFDDDRPEAPKGALVWHYACAGCASTVHPSRVLDAPSNGRPVNPVDYVPSEHVRILITMLIESRIREYSSWTTDAERRFQDGTRHGLQLALRALVQADTHIEDPDDLDALCADLYQDQLDDRC